VYAESDIAGGSCCYQLRDTENSTVLKVTGGRLYTRCGSTCRAARSSIPQPPPVPCRIFPNEKQAQNRHQIDVSRHQKNAQSKSPPLHRSSARSVARSLGLPGRGSPNVANVHSHIRSIVRLPVRSFVRARSPSSRSDTDRLVRSLGRIAWSVGRSERIHIAGEGQRCRCLGILSRTWWCIDVREGMSGSWTHVDSGNRGVLV